MISGINTTIHDCHFIQLDTVLRDEGRLTIVQDIPFDIRRSYYIYDVPALAKRGFHAHKRLMQLMVAVKGRFFVEIKDSHDSFGVWLNSPGEGLIIVPGIWRELSSFSNDAVCVVYASERYDEDDYIRDYQTFLKYKQSCIK